MNEVRTLFEKFWICKDTEKETYYKVKRDIPAFQRFVREQLGWRLVHTENILKLEKRPAHAEPFMGISEFTEIRDYCILCVVLMYLEDKEEQEQFLLSELIDYVETQLKDYMEVDWTSFSQRKSLVRVLQYMEKLQMLRVYEGKSESFGAEAGQEVLYENTGYSKYFATSFPTDISGYQSWEDFEKADFQEVQEDRGTTRINRVYRQLAVCPVMYWEGNDNAESARMEAQLQKAGILDALVVTEQDMDRIRKECPEFQDTVLFLKENGNSNFNGLTVSEELPPELKRAVKKILGNIFLDGAASDGIRLGKDGWFRHGMLFGKAEKEGEAEFIGILARKRRKEQRIHELEVEIKQQKEKVDTLEKEVNKLQENMEQLEKEYQDLPGFTEIDEALNYEKECGFALQQLTVEHQKAETQENKLAQEKNGQYQKVLQKCRPFSYGRTEEAYQEAVDAVEEYIRIWQEISRNLLVIENIRDNCTVQKDGIEQAEEHMDEAFAEKDKYGTKVKQFDIQIHQYEEYLNRPDIAEKAKRLKELREELKGINEESFSLSQEIAVLKDRYKTMKEAEPAQKEELQREISYETAVRSYFEEELSLKLVMKREGKSLLECAKAATEIIRESDRNREAAEMFQSLYQVYQRHNGSLTSYGTSIENCFEADQRKAESDSSALRNRVRIVSTWNGKKVYLEEFYKILKAAIDETELLIQKKDRELFEDILSQTISQQLTDKIAESRKWVSDMSRLMRDMDTSMGLSFSLEWKPRKSENDEELDTVQLEEILLRDRTLLTMDDIEKVAAHFRSKIRMEKQKLEEDNGIMNYMDLVRDALDYRKWFEFRMFFKRGEEQKKPLTNAAFNRFSGGEKAMAMYVPLFAAVNAQYKKAENKDHPRMIALDEAFAGVDDKNISSMFELVHKLDFDYIMNSQALWGCFETVKGLRIAELLRPQNSRIVSVIRYTWNGKERMLDEQ